MTYEGNGGTSVPQRHEIPHYHGNEARTVFVISAIVIVVAQSTGANLPLSTTGAVISAATLVIAAGITNPATSWIHWVNGLFAFYGAFLFGTAAVDQYRAGISVFDPSFMYLEALALLSLLALYFTTQTIRGILQRPKF
ncbi:hypothetical protein HYT04_01200 [Candidatus Kaiserbacteria bacterium]|nr:hypothetical protein [Candidatus Kaiserbacteria bacterium]